MKGSWWARLFKERSNTPGVQLAARCCGPYAGQIAAACDDGSKAPGPRNQASIRSRSQAALRSASSSSKSSLIQSLPPSERKCLPRLLARANRRPQPHWPPARRSPSHTNFFSPEWSPSWLFLSFSLVNAFPHTEHTKGRTSPCARRWFRNENALVNRLGQRVHWNVAGCFWILRLSLVCMASPDKALDLAESTIFIRGFGIVAALREQ